LTAWNKIRYAEYDFYNNPSLMIDITVSKLISAESVQAVGGDAKGISAG
jgi:hypothetical protein